MTEPARPHLHSIADIKDMLIQQVSQVAYHYAPWVSGAYEDKGLYFTLNPGRADRSVGSFWVTLKAGPHTGRWVDKATGEGGDLLDLIKLAMGCDNTGAIQEAKQYLGLNSETPADRDRREKAVKRNRELRARAARAAADDAKKKAGQAQAMWLSAQAKIAGTPVEYYLQQARGIDLARIGRAPAAIRYLHNCYFSDMDPETGEITEGEGPAMVAAMTDLKGNTVGVHRTYLAIGPNGRWGKAPLNKAKKVLGWAEGCCIRIWSGTGPRGGKGAPLAECPPDTRVFIAEGIEDALSCVMLAPDVRVLSAISLDNMGKVALPANVSRVTLISDADEGEQAQQAFVRAVAAHQAQGRGVSVWRNRSGGKDLNDALRRVLEQPKKGKQE